MRVKQSNVTWFPVCAVYIDSQVQDGVGPLQVFAVQPGSSCVPGHLQGLDITS